MFDVQEFVVVFQINLQNVRPLVFMGPLLRDFSK